MRLQRGLVAVLGLVVSMFTVYVLASDAFAYSPVLFEVNRVHGLHQADIPVLGAWLVSMAACVTLWLRPPPQD